MARFIDPRVDWAFKRIFGSEDTKECKLSREELELYDEDIKNMRDIYATRKFDEKKGIEIGMAKGRAEGMEKEKLATARRLLSMGLSEEQVSTATELPLEEIQKMKEQA